MLWQKGKEYEGWARTIYHQNPDTSYPVAQILVTFKQVVKKTGKIKTCNSLVTSKNSLVASK
ncbi:MAG: hypothetical protein LBS02_05520 [Hungatella sp.]|jgi:hypothetical protein|nr:hypothetical protein [Hungatella sp.]